MNQLQKLLICLLAAVLTGCGEFSYDVGQSRRYTHGGYVPGRVYRLQTDAIVIAPTDTPYRTYLQGEGTWVMADAPPADTRHQRFLQRAAMPHPPIFKIVRRVPAGSQLRIDSLRRRFVIVAGFSMGDWVEVHGSILDRQNGTFTIEGDSDLSTERTALFTPSILIPNPKYLKDITPHAADHMANRSRLTPTGN